MSQLKEIFNVLEIQYHLDNIISSTTIASYDNEKDAIDAITNAEERISELPFLTHGVDVNFTYAKLTLNETPKLLTKLTKEEKDKIISEFESKEGYNTNNQF